MKVDCILTRGILHPANDATADILMNLGTRDFVIDLKEARSPHYHRFVMAKIRMMMEMVDTTLNFEGFRKMLTIKAGYFTTIGKVNIKGETSVAVAADSLSFENMDELEFRECWMAIHQAFVDKFGARLDESDLTEWSRM